MSLEVLLCHVTWMEVTILRLACADDSCDSSATMLVSCSWVSMMVCRNGKRRLSESCSVMALMHAIKRLICQYQQQHLAINMSQTTCLSAKLNVLLC